MTTAAVAKIGRLPAPEASGVGGMNQNLRSALLRQGIGDPLQHDDDALAIANEHRVNDSTTKLAQVERGLSGTVRPSALAVLRLITGEYEIQVRDAQEGGAFARTKARYPQR